MNKINKLWEELCQELAKESKLAHCMFVGLRNGSMVLYTTAPKDVESGENVIVRTSQAYKFRNDLPFVEGSGEAVQIQPCERRMQND